MGLIFTNMILNEVYICILASTHCERLNFMMLKVIDSTPMQKYYLFLFLLMMQLSGYSQVGINTTSPSTASVLDVESSADGVNYGGLMIPRVTLAERNLIPATVSDDGLMVYLIDGTNRCVQIWNATDLVWDDVYCMPVNQVPVASVVAFSGILQEAQILTASFSYTDSESDVAGSHTYIWYKADDISGTNQTQLQTGTSNTFTLTASEIGFYIAVEVTPVAVSGTSPGVSVFSTYDGAVLAPSALASDLFISEYVEGSGSYNKVIEVANFTGSTIDLSGYKINIYVNGGVASGATSVFPSVNLVHGDVFVISHNSTVSPCNDNSDGTFGWAFNGNDVIELVTSADVRVDILGTVGSSSDFAKDVTLRKKVGIGPNTTYTAADYDSYPQDACDDLGSHTY